MTSTIGNPLSWGARNIGAAGRNLSNAARHTGGDGGTDLPALRRIGVDDLKAALSAGWQDFLALRSDVIFACMLYPIIGVCLIWAAIHREALPLIFPLASGFALIGPVAAIGLYELSRRREAGEDPSWFDMFSVWHAPGIGGILALGGFLAALFLTWLTVAWILFSVTMGGDSFSGAGSFLGQVFGTAGGWTLILIGVPVGFMFAVVALSVSVISFPLMLDRDVGLPRAVVTSLHLMRDNPRTVLTWGAIVVAGLVIGAIPFLLGLAVTLPVLGHATWHLYRRAVV